VNGTGVRGGHERGAHALVLAREMMGSDHPGVRLQARLFCDLLRRKPLQLVHLARLGGHFFYFIIAKGDEFLRPNARMFDLRFSPGDQLRRMVQTQFLHCLPLGVLLVGLVAAHMAANVRHPDARKTILDGGTAVAQHLAFGVDDKNVGGAAPVALADHRGPWEDQVARRPVILVEDSNEFHKK